jgi:ankyrin repeat protein
MIRPTSFSPFSRCIGSLPVLLALALSVACARQPTRAGVVKGPLELQMSLEDAIERQDIDAVRAAVARGADSRTPLPSTDTALCKAVALQNVTLVRELLASGADPNERSPFSGITPLVAAVHCPLRVLTETLVKAGADPNLRVDGGRMTPLGYAAMALGGGGALTALVDAGAEVDSWNSHSSDDLEPRLTPLMLAAKSGIETNVLILLERGADPNIKASDGRRAMDLICDVRAQIADALSHPERFGRRTPRRIGDRGSRQR